ncbi:hypothetical protein pkur_cds_85 [Pandoravirus kuranda]|uniref:Uncharacterized protein n=1 Tax=Pandoravirus kuranda TaxID=3019033 RepID=A0AA95EE42_9VIRU|nr:hypothetical protein pkur_cds_85 [Pandoravirus kuranda]
MLFEFFAVVGALFSLAFVVMAVIVVCVALWAYRSPKCRRSPPVEPAAFAAVAQSDPSSHSFLYPCAPIDVPLTTACVNDRACAGPIPVYPVVQQNDPYIPECQQKLAIEALDAAAAFGVGDMHTAKAIVEAASATPRDASLDLYVVPGPCAGMPGNIVTLATMRNQWPRLFEHGDPGTAEGAKVWSLMLLPDPARFGRVAFQRVVLDRAMLDAEFGPREDPLVARLRTLVPAVPPPM